LRWPSGRPRCGSQSSFAAARREPLAGGGYARLGLVEPALTFALFDFGIDRTGAAEAAVQSIFAVALSWLLLRRASSATFWLVLASSAAAALQRSMPAGSAPPQARRMP
jgi:hypothetical protein